MQHLTLVPSASQFLFRERPSHNYCASHLFALPLTKKMEEEINETKDQWDSTVASISAHFLIDDVKFNGQNRYSLISAIVGI